MTDKVIDLVDTPEEHRILEFVRHTIAASLAHGSPPSRWQSASVDVAVDVERLFASVEFLIDRNNHPWSPFVATWHPGLEAFAGTDDPFNTRFFTIGSLQAAIRRLNEGANSYSTKERSARDAAKAVADYVDQAISRSGRGDVSKLLKNARAKMLRSLFQILNIDDMSGVEYLLPLVDLARRQGSLAIATLNYDRSIEDAAEVAGEPCDTGIETWLESGALVWPESGLHLLKLHGSIDWVYERRPRDHALPLQHIRKVAGLDEEERYDAPAIVFGEAGKLRSEGPFLELLLAWSAELARANHLLVVGYSFRDVHVNEVIARWFNADANRRIVILDPGDLTSHDRDSFGVHLMHVDDFLPPDQRAKVAPRVTHIPATTAQSLGNAIEEAFIPAGASIT